MHLALDILKWVSQVIYALLGMFAVGRNQTEEKNGKKRITFQGKLAITGIVVTFLLFLLGDLSQRREISKLRLNRDIAGIDVSFTPSAADWSRIEAAFNKIPPQVKETTFSGATIREVSFSEATMRAERSGDSWKINFDPLKIPAGVIRFPPISPNSPSAKAFADVIQEALPSLWIKWGANATTEIEPRGGDQYPSAVTISRNLITLTLRSPELKLKLNQLDVDDFSVLIRANSQPPRLWFKSADDGVTLDQTLDMNWKTDQGNSQTDTDEYIKRTKPFVSGPHPLQLKIKS